MRQRARGRAQTPAIAGVSSGAAVAISTRMRKLGLVVGVLALAAGCDSSDASLGGELVPGPATVGAAGGTVVSSDGRAVLAIAPGALSAEIIISIDAGAARRRR